MNSKLSVDYIKSHFFRVVHADGVWGSITAAGAIHMDIWNSREAIPRRLTYTIDEQGRIVDVQPEVRADQVREVEVGVVMDVETAKAVCNWLLERIEEAEQFLTPLTPVSEEDHD